MKQRLTKRGNQTKYLRAVGLVFSLAMVAGTAIASIDDDRKGLEINHQAKNGEPALKPIKPKQSKPIIEILFG